MNRTVLEHHPSTLLGLKLTSTQQVLFCFVVPAIVNCTIYIIDFATNIAVVERHFEESNVKWAILTLLVLYVHSFVYFTLTVSNVDKWNEQIEQSREKRWFLARLLQLVAFPIFGIFRYAKVIFWSLEALFQSGTSREDALKNASRPSHLELYLFLQAFLQGLPQAAFQIFILFCEHNDNRQTDSMQVLCIASSLMIVATITVSFQRFESQKNLGRIKPWATISANDKNLDRKSNIETDQINTRNNSEINDVNGGGEINASQSTLLNGQILHATSNQEPITDSTILKLNKDEEKSQIFVKTDGESGDSYNLQCSETIPYLESEVATTNEIVNLNHESEVSQPVSVHTDCESGDSTPYLQPRVITHNTNVSLDKDSLSSLPFGENNLPHNNSDTTFREHPFYTTKRIPTSVEMESIVQSTETNYIIAPVTNTRKPLELPTRRIPIKGLEEDDLAGKSVSFLMWFFFLSCRMFAIVSFSYFYPWPGLGVVLIHYSITLLIIHKCFQVLSSLLVSSIFMKIYLAFIFCFCLIEFKIKFKKTRLMYTVFFIFISAENVILNTAWFLYAEWDGWWYTYTYILFWVGQTLHILCLVMYFHTFKPKTHVFYRD